MEATVAQVFRIILLVILDLFSNSMTQSRTDFPTEAQFKAEYLVSDRSEKTFWCVHCVCISLFFYIVTS